MITMIIIGESPKILSYLFGCLFVEYSFSLFVEFFFWYSFDLTFCKYHPIQPTNQQHIWKRHFFSTTTISPWWEYLRILEYGIGYPKKKYINKDFVCKKRQASKQSEYSLQADGCLFVCHSNRIFIYSYFFAFKGGKHHHSLFPQWWLFIYLSIEFNGLFFLSNFWPD